MLYYTFKTRIGTDNDPDEDRRDETFKDGADCVRYVSVKFADLALGGYPDDEYETAGTAEADNYGEDFADGD